MFRQKIEKDIERLITDKERIEFVMEEARGVLDSANPANGPMPANFRPTLTNVLLAGILLEESNDHR